MAVEFKNGTYIGDSWDEIDVEIPRNKLGFGNDLKIKNCPECKKLGKRMDFSLSVNPAAGKGKCHKCGTKYIVRSEQKETKQNAFTPPSRKNLTKLKDDGLQYFVNRRISQQAINEFKIGQRNDWVAFPYFFEGELVNIKYKWTAEKKYTQSPGGKHVVFNYDNAKKSKVVLIAEGEEECMCWFDAGFAYATSVDAGAPNPNDIIDKKLECITNSFDLFEQAETIYIAVDNDENGRRLQQELLRRFNVEKCKIVNFAPYKDANEYVLFEGHEKLIDLLANAKEVRMEGIFTVDDVKDKLWDIYNVGLPKGTTTYYPSIDKRWKWRESEVTIATGYANDGKSTLMNVNLPTVKSVKEGWKHGLFIPENFPAEEFFEEVIHCYIGKTADKNYPKYRMSPEEYQEGMNFANKHFFLVFPEEKQTMDELFERFDYLVRKEGIKTVIIDPYNAVDHLMKPGETIDQYVTRFMSKLRQFARKRNVCVILVAHQNPPDKRAANGKDYPSPDMYKVKNGGSFADRTDNLIAIHRPFRNSDPTNPSVIFISQKIKKKKLLGADTGEEEIQYNYMSNRYEDSLLGGRSPLDDLNVATITQVEVEEIYGDDEEETDLPF